MTNPLVPNYKKDVGRLVADRYDFEKHLNGTDFRHVAGQIDLFPTVVVDGYAKTTVQDAISALSEVIYAPSVPDATPTSLGVIQLDGDISGTAYNISVVKIQGKPISTLIPSTGQVLSWNGSYWAPSNPTNSFSAGLDLYGNNVAQSVIQISGNSSGDVSVPASTFNFSEASTPIFNQQDATLTSGSDFTITAQNSVAGDGGNVLISGGFAPSGTPGGVVLSVNDNTSQMVQVSQFSDSRRVVALFGDSQVTDGDIPDGDMMLYIKDAASDPISGNPYQGVLVYSNGGKLNVKQSDGTDIIVGSIPNPSIWGNSGEQTYTVRRKRQTVTNSPVTAFSYLMPNNSSVKVDVIVVAKEVGSDESYQVNMSAGYSIDSFGTVTVLGSTTSYDIRNTGGISASWSTPNITNTGPIVNVITGHYSLTTINWLMITQLSIVGD